MKKIISVAGLFALFYQRFGDVFRHAVRLVGADDRRSSHLCLLLCRTRGIRVCEHRQHLQIVTAIPIHGDILYIDAQPIGQMQDRGPLVHTAGRDLKMPLVARRIVDPYSIKSFKKEFSYDLRWN